jgi:hypothetical protein
MVVKVASRLGQAISRTFSASNVVGDGMLVRLRSTSIGILGLVAAVGLGLVGFVSQQGWPEVASGPPPQVPLGLEQNDPIAMPRSVAYGTVDSRRRSRPIASTGSPASVTAPSSIGAGVGGVPAGNVVGTDQPKTGGDHSHPPPQPTSPTVAIETPSEEAAPAEGSSLPESGGPPAPAPGHSGESHGHNGEPHGNSGAAHGNSGAAPGHSGESRGRGH